MSYGYRPARMRPWSFRQQLARERRPVYGVPVQAPPPPRVGQGEIVAYTVSHKCGPMQGVVLEVADRWALVYILWKPTGVSTILRLTTDKLRPWTREDDDHWQHVRDTKAEEKRRAALTAVPVMT